MAGSSQLTIRIAAQDTATQILTGMVSPIANLGNELANVGKIAAGVALGGLFAQLGSSISEHVGKAIDEVQTFGQAVFRLQSVVGGTTESASGLLAVFQRFGLDVDTAGAQLGVFAKHMAGMQDTTEGALPPTKSFAQSMKELGVTFLDAHGAALPLTDVLLSVADKFAVMDDGANKTAVAMQLFGRSGRDLIPILDLGRQGILEAEAAAKKYGLTLSTENVAAIREFGFAHKDLDEAMQGLSVQIGLTLMPLLSSLATTAAHLAEEFNTTALPVIRAVAEYISDTFGPYIQAGIALAGEAFNSLSAIVSSAMSSVLSVLTSVGQAILDALSFLNPFAEHSPSLVSQVADGMAAIVGSYGGITDIATPLGDAGDLITNFAGLSKAAIKEMVTDSKADLGDMKQALADATKDLRDFTTAPIQGMGALDDQKFAMQQQKDQIQLQIDQLKLGGAVAKDIMTKATKGHPATVAQAASPELIALEKQLSDLGLKANILDLQGKLKFDPLQRQIKQMTTTTKELTFDQITKGITFTHSVIALLTPAIARNEAALKLQEAAATAAAKAVRGHGGAAKYAADGLSGMNSTLDTVKGTIQGFNEKSAIFKERVDAIITSVQNFIAPIKAVASSLGELISGKVSLGDFLTGIKAQLAAWGQAFLTWIADVAPKIPVELTKIGQTVYTWIVGQATLVANQLTAWAREFWAWVQPAIPPMLAELDKLKVSLFAWIDQTTPQIGKQLESWTNAFVAWVVPTTTNFLAEWPGMLNKFLDWIEQGAVPILEQLGKWGLAFVDWIVPRIPDILMAAASIPFALYTFIDETKAVLEARLIKWGLAFVNWIPTMIPALLVEMTKLGVIMDNWIAEQASHMAQGLANMVTGGQAFPAVAAPPSTGAGGTTINNGHTFNTTVNGVADPQASANGAHQGVLAASRAFGFT